MLQLKNLHIGYKQKGGNKILLDQLNVNFEPGNLIALVGNNGTGKSTLIKTLSGMLDPLAGEVRYDDKNISFYKKDKLSELISIVLTEKIGGFNLKSFDVTAAGRIPSLNPFGKLHDEDIKITNECMDLVGVKELSETLFEELSDGQKQKVLIAKSLAQQTPVILMDEPTAFLDYNSRKNLFELLNQLAKEKQKIILVSSHDLDILFKYAGQTLYLRTDKTYFFGETKLIKDEIFSS